MRKGVRSQLNRFQQDKALARHRDAASFSQQVDRSIEALGLGEILDGSADTISEDERALLRKHLQFYLDLTTGRRRPTTAAQRHFIAVVDGQKAAATEHERAFMKWRRSRSLERSGAGR